jgi:hypothetical protein
MAQVLNFPVAASALSALREFNRLRSADAATAPVFGYSSSYQIAQARALNVSSLFPLDVRDKVHNELVARVMSARGFAGAC